MDIKLKCELCGEEYGMNEKSYYLDFSSPGQSMCLCKDCFEKEILSEKCKFCYCTDDGYITSLRIFESAEDVIEYMNKMNKR